MAFIECSGSFIQIPDRHQFSHPTFAAAAFGYPAGGKGNSAANLPGSIIQLIELGDYMLENDDLWAIPDDLGNDNSSLYLIGDALAAWCKNTEPGHSCRTRNYVVNSGAIFRTWEVGQYKDERRNRDYSKPRVAMGHRYSMELYNSWMADLVHGLHVYMYRPGHTPGRLNPDPRRIRLLSD